MASASPRDLWIGTEVIINGHAMRAKSIEFSMGGQASAQIEFEEIGPYIHTFGIDWGHAHGDEVTFTPHPSCKSLIDNVFALKEGTMSTSSRIKELNLDDDTRLLRKYDIVDTEGDLTEEGTEVLLALLFEQNKTAVIDNLKTLEKADAEAA